MWGGFLIARCWIKPCILGLLWLAVPVHGLSEGVIKPVHQGVIHDALYDLSFEGDQGLAVGGFGMVLQTSNGGHDWSSMADSFTELGLFGVVRKQGRCVAVGQQGVIFHSADCQTWVSASSSSTERLLEVDMNAAGVAYAVGGFGVMLKSTDWGETWSTLSPDWEPLTDGIEPHLYAVDVDEDGVVTVVGEFELIMRSSDGGETWVPQHQGLRSLFGMHLLPNGEGYAVGQEGVILKTSNHGADGWHELDSPTQSILTGIKASSTGRVRASGIYTLLHSEDGGQTFTSDESPIIKGGWYQELATVKSAKGEPRIIVVGARGLILSGTLKDKIRSEERRK